MVPVGWNDGRIEVWAKRVSSGGRMGLLTILKKIKLKEKEVRLLILCVWVGSIDVAGASTMRARRRS